MRLLYAAMLTSRKQHKRHFDILPYWPFSITNDNEGHPNGAAELGSGNVPRS